MLLREFTVPQQQQKTPRVIRWEDEEEEDGRLPFHRLDDSGDGIDDDARVDTTITPSASSLGNFSGEALTGRAAAAAGGELWPSPLRRLPRAGVCPSAFKQILAISPIRKHSEIRSDEGERLELPQPRTRESCRSSSSSTRSSSSCSGATVYSNIQQETGARKADELVRRFRDSGDQDTPVMAAPMHASSSPLSPSSPCVGVVRGRRASSMVQDSTADLLREEELLHVHVAERRDWLPRPLSQSLSPAAIASLFQAREEEGASLAQSATCAFDPRLLSPQPLAVFRPKKSGGKSGKASRYLRHSSTAVHEPRARCGCRGITVQVNCGPLGLSLEASYRMERGLVLKQAWSDCSADKGMFEHSILVQNMPGRDGHVGPELEVGLKESRSSLSGLIKVQAVCIENSTDAAAAATPTTTTVVEPPLPLRPGVIVRSSSLGMETQRSVLEGVLEIEKGDILVRVNDVQVSKKSFADVAHLLDRAKRPTRLTFVRHACGRRFVSRDKDGGFPTAAREVPGRTAFGLRRRGKRGKAGRGYEQLLCSGSAGRADTTRCSSLSPQKLTKSYRQIETEEDTCPVAALLRTRRQLPSGGMEEWHEVVAARGRLWQRLINDLPPDSHSDRAKLRKLANDSCSVDRHARKGRVGLSVRRLMGDYQRLVYISDAYDDGAGCSKAEKLLAARVWEDVDRTMSPRHSGRPGNFLASLRGGGGFGCPAHFTEGSRHAVFRVAYATASTLQLVSGMSYMAALMLVQEPVEAVAYATLVNLLQERKMRLLYPLGDVDLLDAYHLCGGRVVTYRAPSAGHSNAHGFGTERGVRRGSRAGATEGGGVGVKLRDHGDGFLDGHGGDRTAGREFLEGGEEPTKQVVVGKVLPRLVRAFGRALKRRIPTLHQHFCTHAIPMSFLCAEWFTTAYARNTPLPLALCAFDLFSVHLDDGMIRLGLGILEVLAPSLEALNSKGILLQYGGLTANVCFKDVLQRVLATQPCQAPLVQTSSVVGEVCVDSEKSSCSLS